MGKLDWLAWCAVRGMRRNCLTPRFFVLQSLSHVQLLVTPWTAARQASLSITNSWSLLKLMPIESMMPYNLYCLLLHFPQISPSIEIFSSESALCIRWPQYWSFSFSISPSNEYSGLISFRIDCFDLAVHGTLKSPSLLQHHSSKALIHYIVNIRVFGEYKCSDYSKSLALYLENR